MKVQEITTNLTDTILDRFGHDDRTPGLHASQIYEDIWASINKEGKRSAVSTTQLSEFGSVGFLWERVLEKVLASVMVESGTEGRYIRPGEQFLEGIYLTPDYVDLDFFGDGTWCLAVEEWKVRWCSYRRADDLEKNFWKILVQQKAYCYSIRTNFSRLRMLFLVGDWRGDITPKMREFELEFSDQELEDNWSMLQNHAKSRGWL